MTQNKNEIINHMKTLGVDIAGSFPIESDKMSLFYREVKDIDSYKTIVVVGLHLRDPYFDSWSYFDGYRPISPADEFLANIIATTCLKLQKEGYHSKPLIYSGLFLKDAACHANIGIIGKNNLFVTPEFGPRVRLRAFITAAELPHDESPKIGNLCEACDAPCTKACPSGAFDSGKYDKDICHPYASKNMEKISTQTYLWCRRCELSCKIQPVIPKKSEPSVEM
jgi:epoxyqueuosine reductase